MARLKERILDAAIGAFVLGGVAYNLIDLDRMVNLNKQTSSFLEKFSFGAKGLASTGLDLFSYSLYGPVAESALKLNVGVGEYLGIDPYLENPLLCGFLISGTRALMNISTKLFCSKAAVNRD